MTHDPTFWLLARSAGFTAYVLLTLSVLAGLVLKSRPFRSLRPAAVTDTHRTLALLGLGALALHAHGARARPDGADAASGRSSSRSRPPTAPSRRRSACSPPS